MLAYEKERLQDAIYEKIQAIAKQEIRIAQAKDRLEKESRYLPSRLIMLYIRHCQNGIVNKEEDIRLLESDLRLTEEAIESQKRDNQLIASSEQFQALPEQESKESDLSRDPARSSFFSKPLFNLGRIWEYIDTSLNRAENQQDQQAQEKTAQPDNPADDKEHGAS